MFSSFLRCAFAFSSLVLLSVSPSYGAGPLESPPTLDVSKQNPMPAYSVTARARGETGTAVVYIKVDPAGNALRVVLGKTSGYQDLDKAALAAVKEWHFVPGTANGNPVEKWTAIGVRFSLTSVKPTPEEIDAGFNEEKITQSGYDPQQIVCRVDDAPTGSHLQGGKVCHTQKEWDEISRRAERAVERSANNPGADLSGH